MKTCIKCYIKKPISEFRFRKDTNSYKNECKDCCKRLHTLWRNLHKKEISIKRKKYFKLNPWKKVFGNIKLRCNNPKDISYKNYGNRGIQCQITEDEIKFLWFRDKAYLMKKPSIDRIDNDGNYCLENCRFIELSNNVRRALEKPVLQFNKDGIFIKEWASMREIQRILKFANQNISMCCRGNYKQSYGFIWKFKEYK